MGESRLRGGANRLTIFCTFQGHTTDSTVPELASEKTRYSRCERFRCCVLVGDRHEFMLVDLLRRYTVALILRFLLFKLTNIFTDDVDTSPRPDHLATPCALDLPHSIPSRHAAHCA